MIYGILCYDTKKSLKEYPKHIREKIYEEYILDYYFDNLITAMKIAHLKKSVYKGSINCKIFKIKPENVKNIPKEKIVSSFQEYIDRTTKDAEEEIKKLMNKIPEKNL